MLRRVACLTATPLFVRPSNWVSQPTPLFVTASIIYIAAVLLIISSSQIAHKVRARSVRSASTAHNHEHSTHFRSSAHNLFIIRLELLQSFYSHDVWRVFTRGTTEIVCFDMACRGRLSHIFCVLLYKWYAWRTLRYPAIRYPMGLMSIVSHIVLNTYESKNIYKSIFSLHTHRCCVVKDPHIVLFLFISMFSLTGVQGPVVQLTDKNSQMPNEIKCCLSRWRVN